MKIIAIGRNYAAHVNELSNERPEEPVIFTKPDTAIVRNNEPFYHPSYTNEIHYEVEIILKICKEGKSVAPEFAHKYFEEIGIGIDFTARDLQAKAKTKGLPWTLAKGFNGSAPISNFVAASNYADIQNLNFDLKINGEVKQAGNTKDMLFKIPEIIAYISKFITLRKGDLIFTGTPEGVGPIQVGDRLEAAIEGKVMLDFEIK